jgi:plasmid stabilization system protein ParE
MAFELKFTLEAKRDLEEIIEWFSRESGDALANRFLQILEMTAKKIAEAPMHYSIVYKNYRQCRTPVFEYVVTYRIKKKTIEVLAITHWKA